MHYLQLELYKNIRNDLDLFDFIQNTALDGLWYWDLEQPENEWMNPKFWQVLGYDAEKMPHSPSAWQSLINAEDFKIAEQLIHKCISDPTKKYEQVLEYKHKKGHSVYIKCYGKIYCNSEGKPIRMLGAHVDVSETIKSEKKALSEANFLKQIYSTNSIYVLKTDLSGNYTYVNQHYIDFFSGGNNELIGTSVLHGLIPEDQIKCIEVGQSCINHPNKKFPIELTKRINGKRLTAAWEFSSITDHNGIAKEILCIGYDITQQVIQKEDLARTLTMLNNAQHIAKMGAWELNLETGKVYWSDETFLIHELKPSGNVAIEDAISFYHPDDRAIISEALQKTIKTKEPFDVVCRLLTYKNRNIWARSSGFAFVENNKVTKLYGMIQDITQFELDKLAIEREQLFSKQVIESMVDGFSIHSKDGSKLDVNDAFCKMTGFKREDFVGLKPPFKNWPIDSLDNIQKTIENIISIGSGTAEFIFQKKDGTRFPVLTTTSVLKNSNGEVEYYFTNSKDITKQKKAEEDLINKEKRLLQIIKATRIGTWEWNIKSGEILINERWGKTSGYSLNELNPFTIKKWVDLIFPDDLIAFNQKLEECFSKKFEFFECEVRVLHKKEYWVWTLVKGKVFEWSNNGEALHMFGTQENITERKQAEAQLKRNMFELQSLSEQLEFEKKQLSFALNENQAIMHALDQSAMVTIADLKGNIIEANEFFCRNSGFTKSELIGNNHRMINSGVHSKLFWKSMWDTILSGNTWTGEVCNKTKDGKLYWVNAINTPVFDSKNKIYKFLSIRYAITERKEAEEEQKRLQDITQNQNDRLKQFAYIVSHNLRSHSGNIQLLLEFLLNDKPELGENQVFKYVKSASTNLIDTIKHLAEVAHLHNNKPKDLQSLNLHQYIEQAFSNVVAFATKDDTSLINEVDPNLSIIATTTYIESILLNFVSNGIKYRNPDAQSFVKLTSEVLPNSKFIRLSIIDNGLGIDLNLYRSKLFGLYQTFHKNKEAKGIGLFITKNQIEAIGGSVEVDSKPGVGTTFSILLKRDDTV